MIDDVGAGDAPYDSDRSLLKVIHDHLLSENCDSTSSENTVSNSPPPIPYSSKPRLLKNQQPMPAAPREPAQPQRSLASTAGAQVWEPSRQYALGDVVSHGSRKYRCITAHQGQIDWTPDAAVSLWEVE